MKPDVLYEITGIIREMTMVEFEIINSSFNLGKNFGNNKIRPLYFSL